MNYPKSPFSILYLYALAQPGTWDKLEPLNKLDTWGNEKSFNEDSSFGADIDNFAEIGQINSVQNSWKVGFNEEISSLSTEEFKQLCGGEIPTDLDSIERMEITAAENIPDKFDARETWSNCGSIIGSIRNQGHCSSCWAVAVSSVASDRLCIKSNGDTALFLSANNLMTCCAECSTGDACSPGYPSKSYNYIRDTGIVTGGDYGSNEGCQPYQIDPKSSNPPIPTCQTECITNGYEPPYNDDIHKGTSAYSISSVVSEIQTDIMTNGPVTAHLKVYKDFQNYTGGVYVHKTEEGGYGHIVRVIGWGQEEQDDGSTLDYWLVANSWGTRWGEGGFFRILRGANECGFENYITAGLM